MAKPHLEIIRDILTRIGTFPVAGSAKLMYNSTAKEKWGVVYTEHAVAESEESVDVRRFVEQYNHVGDALLEAVNGIGGIDGSIDRLQLSFDGYNHVLIRLMLKDVPKALTGIIFHTTFTNTLPRTYISDVFYSPTIYDMRYHKFVDAHEREVNVPLTRSSAYDFIAKGEHLN